MAGGAKKGRLPIKKSIQLDAPRSDINVTPLVDVCLVLLIIFMVVTPLMARGKEVKLPQTTNHTEEGDDMQVIVAIDQKSNLYFDKQAVPDLKTMRSKIEEAWRNGAPSDKIYVKAHQDLRFEKVRPVLMELHEMGITAIDLGTNERRGGAKE